MLISCYVLIACAYPVWHFLWESHGTSQNGACIVLVLVAVRASIARLLYSSVRHVTATSDRSYQRLLRMPRESASTSASAAADVAFLCTPRIKHAIEIVGKHIQSQHACTQPLALAVAAAVSSIAKKTRTLSADHWAFLCFNLFLLVQLLRLMRGMSFIQLSQVWKDENSLILTCPKCSGFLLSINLSL